MTPTVLLLEINQIELNGTLAVSPNWKGISKEYLVVSASLNVFQWKAITWI